MRKIVRVLGVVAATALLALTVTAPALAGEDDNHHRVTDGAECSSVGAVVVVGAVSYGCQQLGGDRHPCWHPVHPPCPCPSPTVTYTHSPRPSHSASHPASHSATATASASHPPASTPASASQVPGQGEGPYGQNLPVTGAAVPVIIGTAVALLLAGIGAVRWGRRRRAFR